MTQFRLDYIIQKKFINKNSETKIIIMNPHKSETERKLNEVFRLQQPNFRENVDSVE